MHSDGCNTEEEPEEDEAPDTTTGSAMPCNVTVWVDAGLVSEQLDCCPQEGQAVTLGDVLVAVSSVLTRNRRSSRTIGRSLLESMQPVFVWGPDNAFGVEDPDYLRERFVLHSDGKVQCGRLLEGKGGGRISEASDSFEVLVRVRNHPERVGTRRTAGCGCPSGRPAPWATCSEPHFPLERGIARVDHHSWRKLEPPNWFDDELCNAFLFQVNTGTPSGTAAYCVSTFFMPALVAGAMPYHRAAAIFLPRGQEDSSPWSRYNMLLVPLHIDDNHWACITIQAAIQGPTQIMQLKIYDSLSSRGGRAAAKALAVTLQDCMESTGWKGPVTVEAADCPQQPNDHDCGPFMLLVMCLLALNQPFSDHADLFSNTRRMREKIGKVIHTGLANAFTV